MTEEWKPVDGFKDYEVSNHGRIRRLTAAQGTSAGSLVKPVANKGGYQLVTLRKDGQTHSIYAHDLVGKHFVKGWKKGLTVQHKDHNRTNNRVSNLSWARASDNFGEGRVSKKNVARIRALARNGFNAGKIASALKLQPGVVRLVLSQMKR